MNQNIRMMDNGKIKKKNKKIEHDQKIVKPKNNMYGQNEKQNVRTERRRNVRTERTFCCCFC